MKRILLFFIVLLFASTASAQTQHGIVKTRGRVVNGKVVAGTRLSGATITLNIGNPLVSGQNGAFSFNVPSGKNYSLVAAKKQGYTLADPEYTRRTFKYSASNPFYVVLEDEAQRQADINAATRKVRKTLTAQLEKREEEIEALKAQNKLTEAEYQKRLQELYDNQSKSEQLVKEMAERYAAIDYDQLDEFNRQVQLYIDEGELVKADSLIRSKGDIEQRVEEYHQTVAANEVMRKKLELSEQSVAKALEDISQDLYNQRTIYIQQNKRDSALYCLVLRADLDTLNYETAYDCAHFAEMTNDSIAEKYYLRCLNIATVRQDKALIAEAQHDLGHLYSYFGLGETPDYYLDLGRNYLLQALSNREELYAANPDLYRQDFANTLYQLCLFGLNNEYYEETIRYGIEANKQYRILVCQDDIKERTNIEDQFLWCYQNIVEATCWLLEASKAYEKGLSYINENIEVVDSVAMLALQRWDSPYTHHNVGELYYQLGRLYHTLTDFSKAERFYVQAAEHLEYAYRQDHETGYGRLGDTWWDMMKLYKEAENMEAYDLYLEKSIELYSSDLRENRTELIGLYYNKMLRYLAKKQIDEALAWASANFELDKGDLIAQTGKVIALAYKADEHIDKKEYDEALTIIDYAITLVPDSASISAYCIKEEMTELISGLLKNVQVCKTALYVAKSEILVEQDKKNAALENYELLVSEIAKDNDETLAQLYIKVLELCESLDEKVKYDLYLDNALELYTKLYESQPSIFMASLIELQNKKVRSLLQNHNTDEAIDLARRTYAMDESNRRSKSYLAACNNRKAYEYARQADFDNAYHCIDEAISLRPIHPNFYDSKGEILLMQGRNDEALAMWKKVLDLDPNFLDNYPGGTNLSNGLKKLGLIE